MADVIGNTVSERAVKISFSHPLSPEDLYIYINPDQVTWAYGLNTQTYPTYGGEVVQILSVYFDDLTIRGTTGSVAELEHIYSWFISYMQNATQGTAHPIYNQQPVVFNYYERNWTFNIWPKSLPGFRYGRDVVAPTWTLVAAVKEPEVSFSGAVGTTLSDQIMSVSSFNAAYKGQFATFGVATADFGNTADLHNNPFASSDAPKAVKAGTNVASYLSNEEKKLADTYSGFVKAWDNQDLQSLPQFHNISIPPQFKPAKTTSKQGGKIK